MLDALVCHGMMEVLLAIVEEHASSPTNSGAAESGLSLLLLADLAAGSESAKVMGVATKGHRRVKCVQCAPLRALLGLQRFRFPGPCCILPP